MAIFRLAILSDLHAAPRSESDLANEVKLFTDASTYSTLDHPFASLEEFIKLNKLTADVVVCPGDMTNKANEQALRYVWNGLHNLKSMLGAKEIIATVGNHDVDSRGHQSDSFPRESLMRLAPRFPINDDKLADHYWAHGYYISEIEDVRFLVLNSCWLHEARDELNRGVITSYTLEKLRRDLESLPIKSINIAVCHHHPHSHSELRLGDDDVMRNGQQLLEFLADSGSWLVVHGHKHHPKIENAAGQTSQAVVLACGSFSGRLEGHNASVSRNYFHIVDIDLTSVDLQGKVRSFSWASGVGWIQYGVDPRFPSEFGFGFQGKLSTLAGSIKNRMQGKPSMSWLDLCQLESDLSLLMPKQILKLIEILKTTHDLIVVYDKFGLPTQIGQKL